MALFSAKVPVAVATGIVCFVLGGGLVGLVMSYTLAKPEQPAAAAPADEGGDELKGSKMGMPGAGGAKGGMPGGGGGAKGGKGGGGGGGAKGPSSKTQLAQLVVKLDTLTKKPLAIELNADQKKKTQELLAGLDAMEELKEEEAKVKLDALLKVVEANKDSLEAAGFRWPGPPVGGGPGIVAPGPPPNPFKAGEAADKLKSLQTTLGK